MKETAQILIGEFQKNSKYKIKVNLILNKTSYNFKIFFSGDSHDNLKAGSVDS